MKLTDEIINEAKKRTIYPAGSNRVHDHNDCIRTAYEWIGAQPKTKKCNRSIPRCSIAGWGMRYIGLIDICVAAELHPDVNIAYPGSHPMFNIGKRLVKPRKSRLGGIETAGTMPGYAGGLPSDKILYSKVEEESLCFL